MSGNPSAERLGGRKLEGELRRLEPLALSISRRFYVPGMDAGDVAQLARIGIWQALEVWDGLRPIGPLAQTAATRRVLDAITASHRECRQGDREGDSTGRGAEGAETDLIAELPAPVSLAEQLEQRARLRAIAGALETLTARERRSLADALNGVPYSGAGSLGDKSADNSLQRARAKLRAASSAALAA